MVFIHLQKLFAPLLRPEKCFAHQKIYIYISKHFTFNEGCPNDLGRQKEMLNFTLVDYIDISPEDLTKAGHVGGAKCRCKECDRLKDIEDKFILRMGTFYGKGMNTQDQIQSKTRYNWT